MAAKAVKAAGEIAWALGPRLQGGASSVDVERSGALVDERGERPAAVDLRLRRRRWTAAEGRV